MEEFQKPTLGYDTAKAGGTFVKVGVGVLRKPDDTAYNFREAVRTGLTPANGTWKSGADFVTFTQTVNLLTP